MRRIFINYRHQDSEGYVGRIYDHLVQHFAREDIFMDVDTIHPGADFIKELEEAVAACDVFVAVIGPQWLKSTDEAGELRLHQWNDFVRLEIANALKLDKLVIPVLVGKAKMPAPDSLPDDIVTLARRNAFELSHQRFSYDMQKLVKTIKRSLPGREAYKSAVDTDAMLKQKAAALKTVRDDLVNASDSPLYDFRIQSRAFPVVGDGYPDARLLFIGESPGRYEAERGVPFCGPSGDVLDEMLANIGLKREDVYLTNVLLDRPPDKRDPTQEEIAFYTPFVDRIIDIIQPVVIVTLGRFAMQYILRKLDLPEKRETITKLHGKLIKTQIHYGEIHVVPLFHPALVLYSASKKDTLRKDFEKLKLFI